MSIIGLLREGIVYSYGALSLKNIGLSLKYLKILWKNKKTVNLFGEY